MPPPLPRIEIDFISLDFALFITFFIFKLFPEVDKAIIKSPFLPKPSSCLENKFSKSKSLDIQVITAASEDKLIDLYGSLFSLKRPINSAAKCWLSDALPPLPHQKTHPP